MNISSSIFSKNKDSLHEPALKINEHTGSKIKEIKEYFKY